MPSDITSSTDNPTPTPVIAQGPLKEHELASDDPAVSTEAVVAA